MKANNHRQGIIAAATWECRSNTVRLWLAFLLLLSAMCAKAQEIPVRHRFSPGEEVQYELYFKWGLLMPRAGHATLSIRDAEYEGEPSCPTCFEQKGPALRGASGLFDGERAVHLVFRV